MNKFLDILSKVGETVLVAAVPGGAQADVVLHEVIDHSKPVDEIAVDGAEAAIKVVEGIKGTDIADEAKFRSGCAMLDAGFKLVKDSLKADPDATSHP